jgi:hypothetical protein
LAPTVPRDISLLSNTRLEGCRLEAGGQKNAIQTGKKESDKKGALEVKYFYD